MTEMTNKRQEIAKEIRALLMSSPAALTIEELRRDFHQFMEKPIPFRDLGYSCLEDMLHDMKDVLYITYKKGMMCLEVIPDDTTRHIAKLVSKQKISNPNKYATMRRGPPPRNQKRPLQSVLPHYIRKNIAELFKSYPNGLPLTHFDTAYSKRFGSMFSFARLGFVSMKELLYIIPEIVNLKEFQGGEWRVLPAHMKAPENNWRNTRLEEPQHNDRTNTHGIQHQQQGWGHQQESCQSFPSKDVQYQNLLPYRPDASKKESTDAQKRAGGRGRGMKRSAVGAEQEASVGRGSDSSFNSNLSNEPEVDHDDFSEFSEGSRQLQKEIRDMLAEKPEGVWASQLPFLYKVTYKKLLNFKDQGFMSVIELCNAYPDAIRIERPSSKGDWMLYDARIPRKSPVKDEKQESERKRHASQKCADTDLKEKIRQVVMCKKDGIPLGEFLSYYQKFVGDSLSVEELGFTSVEKFLLSLTDTLLRFKYQGNGIIMVLPLDTSAPLRTDKLLHVPEPEVEIKSAFPEDAILPGACYRQLALPVIGDYFETYVSNIVSPGLFWFQVRAKHTTNALEKLMNQLEYCYKTAEGNQYFIPDEILCVGLVVAAVFPEDDNYHRCVVTKLETGHRAQVYFVDYGNTCSVHKSKLRFLRSKFLKLPIQAIQGRLANVQPVGPEGQTWTMNSRNKLLSLCINKPLVAMATAEKDRVMSLVLIDTSGNDDRCYNDELINEGYAIFKPDDHTTVLTGPVGAPEIPDYNYVYGQVEGSQSFPDTSSVTGLSSHETELSEIKQKFVKEYKLSTDQKIHVINIDGVGRVPSQDISSFLFDNDDVLTGMLQQKRKSFNKIEISMDEYPQVFIELQEYGVIPANIKCLSLYELNSVPSILHVFNVISGELVISIKDVIKKFDPEEAYWKGDVEDEADTESVDTEYTDMDQDKITLTIDTLQYKRKRILQSLMDVTVSQSEEVVNELNMIEHQISQLKLALEKAKPAVERDQFEDAANETLKATKEEATLAAKPVVSASSPVKMTNVVMPMKNTSQPNPVKPTATQPPSQNLTPQQMLYSQLLINQMNQQALMNPFMSQFMLGQMGNLLAGQGAESMNPGPGMPPMPGTLPQVRSSVPPPNLPNTLPQMAGSMIPPPIGLFNMPNMQPQLGRGAATSMASDRPSAPGNQTGLGECPLLPGLLPLLQSLSIGRGDGRNKNNS